jgi:hypothetical protein
VCDLETSRICTPYICDISHLRVKLIDIYRTLIQINHQPDATNFQFIILTFIYNSTRTQHDCHHDKKVKAEAATAVIEFLMMGGKTPETCWAVNKLQDNKLKNCCIWLVTYLNCTMMHEP